MFRERSVRGGQALQAAERSVHGGSQYGGGSVRGGSLYGGGSVRGGSAFAGGGLDRSTHGGERSFRGMTLAAMAAVRLERSVRGGSAFAASREGSKRAGAEPSTHGSEASARGGEREGSRRGAAPAMHRVGSARLLSAGVLCADNVARSASQ